MFPDFNIHSTPLFILAIQGLLFACLLLGRYISRRNITDLFLGLILLITVWHQTTYTIGFMGWYDTYRTTKVNYFLVDLTLFLSPLIYFYTKSITTPHFQFRTKDSYHFIPGLIYLIYKTIVYWYDAAQPGFGDNQNGYLMIHLVQRYTLLIWALLTKFQMAIYLAFAIQCFYLYRKKLPHVFSNTFSLELNWIRNFLLIYTGLFIYLICQEMIDLIITDLSWIQEWWYFFFTSIAIIYVGMVGYFTKTNKLNELNPNQSDILTRSTRNLSTITANSTSAIDDELLERKQLLKEYMERQQPFLNPDLNLIELAKSLELTRAQLSEVINVGFDKNFNDYINVQRVAAVKRSIQSGKHKEFSLLGLAYDCGFNSKATFNRVFKKWTGKSPTEFIKNME